MNAIPVNDFVIMLMIFIRISSAVFTSPLYSSEGIPATAKIFLAIIIAYVIFLTLDREAITVSISGWSLFVSGIKEVLTGLLIGFMLNFVFWGISYAGTLIGFEVGLTMADVFNPTAQTNNNVIGEFIYLGATVIFFLINGHHYIIRALAYSYTIIPIGEFGVSESLLNLLVKYTATIFIIAVKIASPIMVSFFLLHIAEGVLARVIPQMQVFFVVQPIKIGLGLTIVAIVIPLYIYLIKNLLIEYEGKLYTFIQVMGN
ncbi:MAG: flagellar biosynthetic protein FliR [Ignavibacteria bacterium]|nr:flagellar biosynthetic protein FliR [Ignavibacteria bacterium]